MRLVKTSLIGFIAGHLFYATFFNPAAPLHWLSLIFVVALFILDLDW
jgi:hypothetical protein